MPIRTFFGAGVILLGGALVMTVHSEPLGNQQAQSSDGAIQRTEMVTLPRFADLPATSKRVSAEADYEQARADTRFQLFRVTYMSDGLPVIAFIYRAAANDTKSPVIVFNRGSWVRQNAAPELVVTFHRLASGGFAIVAPMYRGSEGAPGRDELGGADLADLLNIRTVAAALPYADPSNLFLYGESRGGMMVLQALRDGFPAGAAATVGAFTDLDQAARDDPESAAMSPQIWPD
jgi:acetyl esterase/lipase